MEFAEYTEEDQLEAKLRAAWLAGVEKGKELGRKKSEQETKIHGVRSWLWFGCDRLTKDAVATTAQMSLDEFDEILMVLIKHPEYSNRRVLEVLGWNSADELNDMYSWY